MEEKNLSTKIMGDIITHMKYAKYLPELHRRETYEEIVTRNKEMHLRKFPELKDEIEEAYKPVYEKKLLPSMRSMQFSGKAVEVNNVRLYNCSYLPIDDVRAFSEVAFLLLAGTGVGVSVQKHHVKKLPVILGAQKPTGKQHKKRFLISDDIEGWADAIKVLVESHFFGEREIAFDFRAIREKGSLLKTSGGKAPGPAPLESCLVKIDHIFKNAISERGVGTKLKPIEIYDIICHIADMVLSGGIRRAAIITLFSLDDNEMLESKYGNWYETNPQRGRSNNSALVLRSQITKPVFDDLWKKIEASGAGEPGILFSNSADVGTNPCFTGDMQLLTAKGYSNFDTLSAKEVDIVDGKGNTAVGKVWCSGEKETIKLYLSDNSFITCTPDHKFKVSNGEWEEACKLQGCNIIATDNNYLQVKNIESNGVQKVYDFSVESTHSGWIKGTGKIGVLGHNCGEISLLPSEMCNLTEINASNIESQEDFEYRAKMASRIATLQATYTDFHYLREIWRETVEKEALIGVSLTGIASGVVMNLDMEAGAKAVKEENERMAKKLGINPSARSTTTKPSGTASLLLGTSSGVHAWYAPYYWRRISVGKNEPIYSYLVNNHPELLEDDYFKPTTMAKIKIPMKAPEGAILRYESAIDTLERVKKINMEWIRPSHVDGLNYNNVSCTISVKSDEWSDVGEWMWDNREYYTGVAVLPYDGGTYTQSPFEECTQEEYDKAIKSLTEIDLTVIYEDVDSTSLQEEVACGGGACEIT